MKRSAFTLIELLVVIAIIALLAAILFPVFSRARENARRAACQSSLKQIGLGMIQYFQDYDEYPPCGNVYPVSYRVGMGWAGQILPYVKSTQVFTCPSERGRPGIAAGAGNAYYSYAYNPGLVRDQNGGANDNLNSLRPISAFVATSKTILLSETSTPAFALNENETSSPISNGRGQTPAGGADPNGADVLPGASWVGQLSIQPYDRHLEGANYLAVDGHVKWMKDEQISYGYHCQSSNPAGYFYGGSGSLYAECTDYNGPGAHAMTMSYR